MSDISQVGGNKLFSKLFETLFASLSLLPPQPMFNKETMRYHNLLEFVIDFPVVFMNQVEADFRRRDCQNLCGGGSFFDGIKTDSQAQKFHFNQEILPSEPIE